MFIQMFTSGKVVWNVRLALKKIWSGSENKQLKFQSQVLLDQHMQLICLNWLGAVPRPSFPIITIFIFLIQLEGWRLVKRHATKFWKGDCWSSTNGILTQNFY
uniref:Uncharacterized protein n=1 Tax=Aegilops tauschii subsp. strangulata TaxID=200361 RepID=A0A453HQY3_AEGTS